MTDWTLWLRALHIMAFAAWMAGMWYLPRLLVYHADAAPGTEMSETFKVMERRLLKGIMNPAMLMTFAFGIALATMENLWSDGWLHAKLALVLAMAAGHGLLGHDVRAFAGDLRPRSSRWYRIFNEVPTLLFVGIVLLVILKPF